MNKRELEVKKSKYDDKEDIEIKKIAYSKNNNILLYILMFIFIFALCFTTSKIVSKYINKYRNNTEIVEISKYKNRVLIVNNGEIKETIDNNSFKQNDEIVIEKINTIEYIPNKNATEDNSILYDIKYSINENSFKRNLVSNKKSQVLVRFSYSIDGKTWNYINNVISTTNSTLDSLIGNYYDISGLITNLNIITGKKLDIENNVNKVYWRSETIFQKDEEEYIGGIFDANFKIKYREWN